MYNSVIFTAYKSSYVFMYNFISNMDYVNILNNMIDIFTNKYVLFFLSYIFVYCLGRIENKKEIVYIENNNDNHEMITENNILRETNKKYYKLHKEYRNKYFLLKKNINEQLEIEKNLIESKFKKELEDLKRENRNLSRVNKRYFEDNIELSKKVHKNTRVLFHTTTGRKLHHKKSCTCLNDIECYNLEIEEKVYDFMERCGIFCKSCI